MTGVNCDRTGTINYREIEDRLRCDLSRAGKQYKVALEYCRELRQYTGERNPADRDLALAEAEQIAAKARQEFWRSLRRFSRFVLR